MHPSPLSRIHSKSLTSAYLGLDNRLVSRILIYLRLYHFITERVTETSQIFLEDAKILPK
jgi:hypothetical protein